MKKSTAKMILVADKLERFSYKFGDSDGTSWNTYDINELEACFELMHTNSKHYASKIGMIAGQLEYLNEASYHDAEDLAELERVRGRVTDYCKQYGVDIDSWK